MNAYQATGKNAGRSRDRLVTAGMPFKASDGYVIMAGVHSEDRLRALWRLIGRDDLLEDQRYVGKGSDEEFYFNNVIPAVEEGPSSYRNGRWRRS